MDFDAVEDANNLAEVRDGKGASANKRRLQANAGYVFGDSGTSSTGELKADLSQLTMTINDLKAAFAEQRYKEARSRYGNRYVDYLRFLGIKPQDSRLQRPEYLGGGKSTITFSEVVQTGPNFDANTGVGNLKGHGINALRANTYKKFYPEHGFVITLMCTMPRSMYTDGVPHEWLKTTKEEYFQREYEHTGQRAVLDLEVYGGASPQTSVFGYQDRYDEYRQIPNTVAGEFGGTLEDWHMARHFSAEPSLNAAFVKCTPTDRIYQSTTNHELQVMAYHKLFARRMLAKKGR